MSPTSFISWIGSKNVIWAELTWEWDVWEDTLGAGWAAGQVRCYPVWASTSENRRRDLPHLPGSRLDGSLLFVESSCALIPAAATLMLLFPCHNRSQDTQRTHSAGGQTRGCFRRRAAHPALNVGTVVVVAGGGDLVHIASSRARHTFDPHCLTICPLLCTHYPAHTFSLLSGLPDQEKLLF